MFPISVSPFIFPPVHHGLGAMSITEKRSTCKFVICNKTSGITLSSSGTRDSKSIVMDLKLCVYFKLFECLWTGLYSIEIRSCAVRIFTPSPTLSDTEVPATQLTMTGGSRFILNP